MIVHFDRVQPILVFLSLLEVWFSLQVIINRDIKRYQQKECHPFLVFTFFHRASRSFRFVLCSGHESQESGQRGSSTVPSDIFGPRWPRRLSLGCFHRLGSFLRLLFVKFYKQAHGLHIENTKSQGDTTPVSLPRCTLLLGYLHFAHCSRGHHFLYYGIAMAQTWHMHGIYSTL